MTDPKGHDPAPGIDISGIPPEDIIYCGPTGPSRTASMEEIVAERPPEEAIVVDLFGKDSWMREPIVLQSGPGKSYFGKVMASRYALKLDADVSELEDGSFLLSPRDGSEPVLMRKTDSGWETVPGGTSIQEG